MSVVADREAVEAVSEILSRVCGGGVAVEAPFDLVDDGLSARVDPSRPVTVRGYLPAIGGSVWAKVEQAARDLGHLQAFDLRPIGQLTTRVLHEEDWAEAWKSRFPVLRIGRRLIIRPSWLEHDAGPDEVIIALDPGMAFGTGLHPTTQLCLAAIEDLADAGLIAGARVLDVGSGSGILSVAAGLLGAREVAAVDVDPMSAHITQANAGRNGLASVIKARAGTVGPHHRDFDIVLANLIASLLVDLAGELRRALPTDGVLVAGGIFADREEEVRSALSEHGLRVTNRYAESDWITLTARADP